MGSFRLNWGSSGHGEQDAAVQAGGLYSPFGAWRGSVQTQAGSAFPEPACSGEGKMDGEETTPNALINLLRTLICYKPLCCILYYGS